MSHSVVEVYIHFIFSTKKRKPWLQPEIEDRLFPYMGGIARKQKAGLLDINGTPDHIHLSVKMPATIAISKLIGDLKAQSTGWLKKRGLEEFAWQEGYGAFSFSRSQIDTVRRYIKNQKIHHRTKTFEEEMQAYAKRFGFEWYPDPEC